MIYEMVRNWVNLEQVYIQAECFLAVSSVVMPCLIKRSSSLSSNIRWPYNERSLAKSESGNMTDLPHPEMGTRTRSYSLARLCIYSSMFFPCIDEKVSINSQVVCLNICSPTTSSNLPPERESVSERISVTWTFKC